MSRFNVRFFDDGGQEILELQRLDQPADKLRLAAEWFVKNPYFSFTVKGEDVVRIVTFMEMEAIGGRPEKAKADKSRAHRQVDEAVP